MNDALSAEQILIAGASGALIVLFGACYAFFYSLNFVRPSRYWPLASLTSFGLLTTCALMLSVALELEPFWLSVIGVALLGYYFTPRWIWHLTIATHAVEENDEPQTGSVQSSLGHSTRLSESGGKYHD